MSDTSKLSTCQLVCWGLAVLVGLLVLWSTSGEVGFFAALLLCVAFAVFFGLVISRLICTGHVAPNEEESTALVDHPATTAVAPVTPTPVPTPVKAKSGAVVVKSGTALDGEEELSARKGTWRYEGEAQDKPAAAKASDTPAGTGTRPEALSAPKGGKADDLKQIKGVGPKLETLCNELGFYHFDQIAGWGADEVTWVDQNLKGFKGRVSRDNWVEQAKVLAAGGETEFSKRVAKGGVYEG